ncbi:hypothetical protein RJZ56_006206 [Blastomyces dermatitidis]|uniref:Uncharacterized protein n=3 Tax=Blastomyces TaxID=229219 RepID=A0A179UWR8_BLAGS|nr:uncharacterized protein BDBG_07837 [Blastomyces gilchristii SLH14081]XP_045278384.1 uncharacterized protein BDCG_07065 [Blastomyces dermatitidis ER-3]EQL33930.1 hypothetical protein BDFG_04086 [Blastomyces dermatitidis ATCC 26199]KMW68633.1 hypothetical protein BDDG_12936 [Blastomyces dermatitidis ATCC 18188]EEQ91945.1 hypothetical protein BDCG_07065 [Blastomyces dermatitidis ER-3]OAT12504.1 hypothetical protein BDBG_07837 [Blastomyces gilchristii SLH14081]
MAKGLESALEETDSVPADIGVGFESVGVLGDSDEYHGRATVSCLWGCNWKPGLYHEKAGFLNGAGRHPVTGCEPSRDQEPRYQPQVLMESGPSAEASDHSGYHHEEKVDGFDLKAGSFLQNDAHHRI